MPCLQEVLQNYDMHMHASDVECRKNCPIWNARFQKTAAKGNILAALHVQEPCSDQPSSRYSLHLLKRRVHHPSKQLQASLFFSPLPLNKAMNTIYFVVWTILLNLAYAAPAINPRAALIQPTDDPFYSAPSGYESEELGAILRFKKVDSPIGLFSYELDVQAIYQILVRSEDTFHNPNAIVATVFVPYNADPGKLVSYHMAEDTASPNCAPSYGMKLDAPALTQALQVELALVVPLLSEGYFVVVPDYEGPQAAFIAGYQSAHAILNCIRGTLSLGSQIGINSDAEVVTWGYSGGGIATGWAVALHPTYAPELNILGAAMGGLPVEPLETAKHTMGTLFAGFIFAAILGLSHEYPQLAAEIPNLIVPELLDVFDNAQNLCLIEILGYFAFGSWEQYAIDGPEVLNNPLVLNITTENSLLANGLTPTVPIFIYSSENDEVNPIESTDKLYELYCSKGVNVEYRKDVFSEHVITAVGGCGLAINFVKDRFNKVELNPTCQNSTVGFSSFNEGGLVGLGDIAWSDIDIFLGNQIGRSSSYANTTAASSGKAAGSLGLVATILNFVLSFIQSAITPENVQTMTSDELHSDLAGFIRGIINSVSSVTSFISGIFGFGSTGGDSTSATTGNSSTTSLGGGLVSSLLSTGTSLVSGLLDGNSTSDSSSSLSSGGILSSVLSAGSSLVSSLLTS